MLNAFFILSTTMDIKVPVGPQEALPGLAVYLMLD